MTVLEVKPVDPEELSHEHGVFLVRIARRSVEYSFKGEEIKPSPVPGILERPGAAFVTIEEYHGRDKRVLRGCIGFIRPVKPLYQVVLEVAKEAAFNDPRFPPLRREELDRVTFEVSVLSEMEPAPRDFRMRRRFIKIGRDGLMVSYGLYSGLLLPQVPVEYGWTEEEFLSETCIKAGLEWDCWMNPDVDVYRFRSRVWREVEPNGDVEERDLNREWMERMRG